MAIISVVLYQFSDWLQDSKIAQSEEAFPYMESDVDNVVVKANHSQMNVLHFNYILHRCASTTDTIAILRHMVMFAMTRATI